MYVCMYVCMLVSNFSYLLPLFEFLICFQKALRLCRHRGVRARVRVSLLGGTAQCLLPVSLYYEQVHACKLNAH